MDYLRLYSSNENYQLDFSNGILPKPSVSYVVDTDKVHYIPIPIIKKTVKDLIDEGYAIIYNSPSAYDDYGLGSTSNKGSRIRILSSCPYSFKQIEDIEDVALNNKQIYNDVSGNPIDNIIVWNDKASYTGLGDSYGSLPNGFSNSDIIKLYNNKTINFKMSPLMFANVDFTGVDNFTLEFSKNSSWQANAQGIFRGSALITDSRPTPLNIKIVFGTYSSVFQRMFQHCHTTKKIELSGTTLSIQASGMFEYCNALEEIVFNCNFNWNDGNLVKSTNNMFHNCYNLTVVPLKASLSPTEENREAQKFKPNVANCYDQMFCNCSSLTTIMPVLDFEDVLSSNLELNGGTFSDCNVLSNIRIKNLNNCDWDFVSNDKTSLPSIDATSINYMLNNVKDVTSNGGYNLILPTLHQSEVDSNAIANATSKGWSVIFGEPTFAHSLREWEVNEDALSTYTMTDQKIIISKFKPNTWLIKYTPTVEADSTMNQAVYDYLHNFEVKVTGIEAQTGDDLPITWYKTNNDGSGYYCRGILLAPYNSSNVNCVTAYPWEMGVTSGYFKNPNHGYNYYGYTSDGNIDLYTYNSTHTYPENTAAYAGLAIYTGTDTDSDGYITLDTPIIIKIC